MTQVLKNQYQTLFAWHFHTRGKLVERATLLPTEAYFENPGYGHGSIHALLFHLVRADRAWRTALETGTQPPPEKIENYPDLSTLQTAFTAEQQGWLDLLAGLSGEQIAADLELTTWRGSRFTIPCWRVLQHLILHGMQHHTELAHLLTLKGHSPGDLDFIFFDR